VLLNPDFTFENECSEEEPEKPDKFECLTCSKVFRNTNQLQSHNLCHHEPVQCEFCSTFCIGKRRLQAHVYEAHRKIRESFPCPTCGEAFTTAFLLTRHQRKYHGNNPFRCPHCSASYKRKDYLTDHLSTHSGQLLPCPHCEKEFKAKPNLRKHIRYQHPNERLQTAESENSKKKEVDAKEKKFGCTQCNKSFKWKSILNTHVTRAHGPRNVPCPQCEMMFSCQDYLRKHIKFQHSSTHSLKKGKELAGNALSTT